ncbi:MAG: carboxymuconolactone decarboxylase family protein [Methanomethylophilus sp.]|jgi:AhpD family alkylhydroperoxidase
MENDEKLKQRADEILAAIKEEYGEVPVVNKVLSERPDLFVPNAELSTQIFEGEGHLDKKTRHLIALAAAVGCGGEYCMRAQMKDAIQFGATRDEILEVLEIASYMGLTRCQSYAFRAFAENYGVKLD